MCCKRKKKKTTTPLHEDGRASFSTASASLDVFPLSPVQGSVGEMKEKKKKVCLRLVFLDSKLNLFALIFPLKQGKCTVRSRLFSKHVYFYIFQVRFNGPKE